MRNQLDKIHRAQNKVNNKLYAMDYSNFAAMLPEKVVFTTNDIEPHPLSKRQKKDEKLIQ